MLHIASLGSLRRAMGAARSKLALAVVGVASLLAASGTTYAQAGPEGTTSQASSNQLNQLFLFENTPNKSAAGEAYVNVAFQYLDFGHDVDQWRFNFDGQYSFTDQLAVGALIPIVNNDFPDGKGGSSSNTGAGDISIYAQYKMDQIINPELVNLTGEVVVVLPTGSISKQLDTGRFGFRPIALAYKDFGEIGPGSLAAYGLLGFTITTHSDVRWGIAATYDFEKIVGVVEFDGIAGDKMGAPQLSFTPGVVYHGFNPFEFAVGFPIGMNDASPNWGAIVKATFSFDK